MPAYLTAMSVLCASTLPPTLTLPRRTLDPGQLCSKVKSPPFPAAATAGATATPQERFREPSHAHRRDVRYLERADFHRLLRDLRPPGRLEHLADELRQRTVLLRLGLHQLQLGDENRHAAVRSAAPSASPRAAPPRSLWVVLYWRLSPPPHVTSNAIRRSLASLNIRATIPSTLGNMVNLQYL